MFGSGNKLITQILSLLHFIATLYAIYLSFKCNNGFSLLPFMIACMCPYIYIIYAAVTKGFCSVSSLGMAGNQMNQEMGYDQGYEQDYEQGYDQGY